VKSVKHNLSTTLLVVLGAAALIVAGCARKSHPSQGSRHNRGCAVDLSMFDLRTGQEVRMPGDYDEMTERSHVNYRGGSEESRRLRDLLRSAMESEGFSVYEYEWWHYDFKDWREYPILNISFSEISAAPRRSTFAGSLLAPGS
jgi:D-alanyl-D-alanine dipeptidase